MQFIDIISFILIVCGIVAWLNSKFIGVPTSISLMAAGMLMSISFLLVKSFFPALIPFDPTTLNFQYSDFVLNFILGPLLFAGSLHIKTRHLQRFRWVITSYALFGVVISTWLVGLGLYQIAPFFIDGGIPLTHCFLFGAIISPTDPVAVISILKKAGTPKSVETKIIGESLFNDGIGVVVFLTIYAIAEGHSEPTLMGITSLLLEEVVGGVCLGIALGYIGYLLCVSIENDPVELIITIAIVLGGGSIARFLHCSGPLAMVVTGLFIGNYKVSNSFRGTTKNYIFQFWDSIDEIFNALLFSIAGFTVVLVPFKPMVFAIGGVMLIITLIARFVAISIPGYLFNFGKSFHLSMVTIMTWGGLRGGLSIALVLGLNEVGMHRDILLTITYVIVVFSLFVQGATVGPVVKNLLIIKNRRKPIFLKK